MLYHVGALIRLNELGYLSQLREIASVSGGSITAGMLACAWAQLRFDARGQAENFMQAFVEPVTRFARVGIDAKAILLGLLPGFSAAGEIAKAYDRHLFHGATMQDLADSPRFTFMATNFANGKRLALQQGLRGRPPCRTHRPAQACALQSCRSVFSVPAVPFPHAARV